MVDFSSKELDAIEDMLAQLDDLDAHALEQAAPSAAAHAALRDYQQILHLSRAALPVEEPSAAVIAAIHHEARQAAQQHELGPAKEIRVVNDVDRPATSIHSWRRWWLPTLSLVGSAAVVLWMVTPRDRAGLPSAAEELMEKSAPAQARERGAKIEFVEGFATSDENTAASARMPAAVPAPQAAQPYDGKPSESQAQEVMPLRDQTGDQTGGQMAKDAVGSGSAASPMRSSAKKGGSLGAGAARSNKSKLDLGELERGDGGGGDKQVPSKSSNKPASKSEPGSPTQAAEVDDVAEEKREQDQDALQLLSRAQALLGANQPAQAAALYGKLKNHPDRTIRARALLGLSLCASAQGDAAGTADYLRQAKNADPDVR